MRNQALASSIGFAPVVLQEDGFQRRWAVFRESEQSKFLRLWLEKRLTELQALMENNESADVPKLRGQLLEVRKLAGFLEQTNISNEVASMLGWLGLKK